MLTLFAIPNSTTMISETQTVVTDWVPEFLPVIYLTLGVVVAIGTIMLVKAKLGGGIAKILGGNPYKPWSQNWKNFEKNTRSYKRYKKKHPDDTTFN